MFKKAMVAMLFIWTGIGIKETLGRNIVSPVLISVGLILILMLIFLPARKKEQKIE